MNIVITNDDSHRSPLLELAVDYFSRLGSVHLVVPLHEQSWTGKSMSRFTPIHVQSATICNRPALSVSGTPADCVNTAIYNLLPVRPDLVVSGINAGFNMGIGFILSSGTVGACLEANIAGVPAIALSQALESEVRIRYSSDYLIEEATMVRYRSQVVAILDAFMERAFSDKHRAAFLGAPLTWNINFPSVQVPGSSLRAASVGKNRYTKCFNETTSEPVGAVKVYAHSTINETIDPNPVCDASLLLEGYATVSLLDIWKFGTDEDSVSRSIMPLFESFKLEAGV